MIKRREVHSHYKGTDLVVKNEGNCGCLEENNQRNCEIEINFTITR